jgi:hypothetical protein
VKAAHNIIINRVMVARSGLVQLVMSAVVNPENQALLESPRSDIPDKLLITGCRATVWKSLDRANLSSVERTAKLLSSRRHH